MKKRTGTEERLLINKVEGPWHGAQISTESASLHEELHCVGLALSSQSSC